MKYLCFFLIMSCSALTVKKGTLENLRHKNLIGHWSDGYGSFVKIHCEGQFEYEGDYRVKNNPLDDEALAHFAGAHDRDKGGKTRELVDNKIIILPFGNSYKINAFPALNKGRLEMTFEGKTYWLSEKLECNN